MPLKYAVIGSGAIGGFYGAKLANTGQSVHFLFHSDYQYVKEHGLQINSVEKEFHLPKVNCYQSTAEMPVVDVVLVALKTTNNHLLKEMLPPILHPETVVVLIQNGIGMEEDLAAEFPQLNIAGGMAFIASSKQGPGTVLHQDYGKLTLASYNIREKELLQQIYKDFTETKLETVVAPDLASARWQKLQWNIPFNGLTVALNTTTDRIVSHQEASRLSEDLMREVVLASQACQVSYPIQETAIKEMMETTRRMTPYAPSMKLDYDFRREMEIHYIYERPIAIAAQHGFKMEKTEMLAQMLRFKENKYSLLEF